MLCSVSGSTGNAVGFGLAGTLFFITYANTDQGHCAKYRVAYHERHLPRHVCHTCNLHMQWLAGWLS
jgi:hypothetical protein